MERNMLHKDLEEKDGEREGVGGIGESDEVEDGVAGKSHGWMLG
jgi:hypothetical protein